jgi:hypothetical protein
LFPEVKLNLGDNNFQGDRKVESFMAGWLIKEDTDFCHQGTEELVSLYDKCLSFGGNFAEKEWDSRQYN